MPRGGAELLLRLEEIEQVMRQVQIRPLNAVDYEKVRAAQRAGVELQLEGQAHARVDGRQAAERELMEATAGHVQLSVLVRQRVVGQ